ncbi:hypothetical protein VCHA39O220_120136 [Vibrio chagasii]|nr:hypothetical protein VCHA39O220_120136 [Vibrio chagasii]CAH7203512.1 hypothetical protein VCHA39O224_150062 [Vibrio chagasii]
MFKTPFKSQFICAARQIYTYLRVHMLQISPNKRAIQVIGHGIKMSKNARIWHLINLT